MKCRISKSLFKASGINHYYNQPCYLLAIDKNNSVEMFKSINVKIGRVKIYE